MSATAVPSNGASSSTLASLVESERSFLRGWLADAAPAGAYRATEGLWPTRWHGPGHAVLAAAIREQLAPGVEPPTFEELVERLHGAGAADAEAALRQLPPNPVAPADVAGHLQFLLEQADPATTNVTANRATPLLDVGSIFAPLPPVNWLCQPLDIAPGAPVLSAGFGFSGKTVSWQAVALAVAMGMPAWGAFPVRRGRVLHLDYEQGAYLTCLRYQRLARAQGIDPADLAGRLSLAALPAWYLDGDPSDELARLCDGIDLLIVDSFRAACPRTDENASDARIPLDRLTRVAEKTGVTPIVIHHARKPTRDAAGGARMSVRGSGALYDACGSVFVFAAEKGEPIAVSHEKARISGRPHEDFRLWIEDVEIDGDPTAGLRVTALPASTPESTQSPAEQFGDLKRRILELVRAEGTFSGGVNSIRARLRARKDDVSAALEELVNAGTIHQGGTYKAPVLTYTGTESDAE